APRAHVQQIDVLRDNRLDQAVLLQLRERDMRRIRLGGGEHRYGRLLEAQDLDRVAPEGLDRAELERVELRPEPGRGAEVRDAALGRDAGAGEHHARLPLPDQGREPLSAHRALSRWGHTWRIRSRAVAANTGFVSS